MSENIWLAATEVRDSPIHGKGRFASMDIKTGQPIVILIGEIVPKTGLHIPIRDTAYCIVCPQTYINHSDNCNMEQDGQILFRAARDIAAGEELTLDYSSLTSTKLDFM